MKSGSLKLEFDNHQGETRLISSYTKAPFKILRPFYPEGKRISHLVMLHTGGGIVGGDELITQINLNPNSKVLLTTATASKIYRSLGDLATHKINCKIASGACLEWLPQYTIIFNGALYQQQMRIDLEQDATWFAWDINRYGRTARGERFITGDWRSYVEVYQQERLLWVDPGRIFGDEHLLNSVNGLAGCPLTGTLVLIGQDLPSEILQKIQQLRLNYQGLGVTTLNKGLLCRYRGYSTTEVNHLFSSIWSLLRPIYLEVNAILPRIWQ